MEDNNRDGDGEDKRQLHDADTIVDERSGHTWRVSGV